MSEDNNNNDDLNSEGFSDFLGKYNEYFERNKPNHSDLSFLDKTEQPGEDDIIGLLITPDDMDNSIDISNYELSDLGIPDAIKTLEGTEWKLSKLVWFKPEGRVISFALVKTSDEIDVDSGYGWVNPDDMIIDIGHEEVESDSYQTKLDNAIEEEDYTEAARLRDWFKKLNEFIAQAFNLSNNNFLDKLEEKLDEINKFREEL